MIKFIQNLCLSLIKVSSKSTNRRNIVPKKPNYMSPKPSEVNVKTATATSDPDRKLKRFDIRIQYINPGPIHHSYLQRYIAFPSSNTRN